MANEKSSILQLLISSLEEKLTIRKISKIRNINYKSAYQAIMSLHKEGIVNIAKVGNSLICSFNFKFNASVFFAEYSRRENLFKNKNFKVIHSRLKELNIPFVAILFGSYAKGNFTKESDIDLLILSENSKPIEQALNLIPLKIHPTFINYNEFKVMALSKEFSVVSEALKNNIILIGIEEYYRIINNIQNAG